MRVMKLNEIYQIHINKAFLKRLKLLSNEEILNKAMCFKAQNRVMDSNITRSKSFQKNYDTIIEELKLRGLYKNG